MKNAFILITLFLFASSYVFSQAKAGKVDTTKHDTYYACPHHTDVMAAKPGKCVKCGMELKLSSKEQMKAAQTKSYRCPVHMNVVSHDSTKCPQCGRTLTLSAKEQMKAVVTKLYTCPMHPEVALDKEGNCPKCSRPLVEKKTSN